MESWAKPGSRAVDWDGRGQLITRSDAHGGQSAHTPARGAVDGVDHLPLAIAAGRRVQAQALPAAFFYRWWRRGVGAGAEAGGLLAQLHWRATPCQIAPKFWNFGANWHNFRPFAEDFSPRCTPARRSAPSRPSNTTHPSTACGACCYMKFGAPEAMRASSGGLL